MCAAFSFNHMKAVTTETDSHIPVMSQEVQKYLTLSPNACFVDCTLGLGGHSRLLVSKLGPKGQLVGIDRDKDSLYEAKERLRPYSKQCHFVHDDFRYIDKILKGLDIRRVDGMLFDLGISSFQLNNPERGFSIRAEGPLDMRMDQDTALTAYELINSFSEREISSILKTYGEERLYNRIARYLVAQRSKHPIRSTKELRDVVLKALPHSVRRQKIHPATRTFQAIRIAVNRELESIEVALEKCVDYLRVGARICVISFHSLEDRIVKEKFRAYSKAEKLKLVVKKPLRPKESEVRQNPRARSARLRVAERI